MMTPYYQTHKLRKYFPLHSHLLHSQNDETQLVDYLIEHSS
ncbi:Uncharacterised protein [Vibrio cholerae]|nr:Uncharacterised protein [Vibrio cholerae]CSI48028.1 Uncharacterised protein [Vibrio cholerae]